MSPDKRDLSRMPVFVFLSILFLVYPFVPASGAADLQPVVGYSVKNDTSPPLRSMEPLLPAPQGPVREVPMFPLTGKLPVIPQDVPGPLDPVLQEQQPFPAMPSPIKNFDGIGNVNGVLPPDTNGDVGPNHYVQTVNASFAIWDKNGNTLYGPADINTLWSGFGGYCETQNDGDPIVLYDHLADRWLLSQFALPNYPSGPFYQCIAISQTDDPTGAWYRYAFLVHNTKMNDYPKFGVWPDGYYMSVNQFDSGGWAGGGAYVFERDKMLNGQSARFVYFDLYPVDPWLGGMLPSDLDGSTLPPSGAPNYFVQLDDDAWGYTQDQLEVWEFHVDWTTPADSTFTGPTLLATASFDSNMCGYNRNCIPQPGITSPSVDAISDRLMYRLQYRNFGSYETMVTNHTVDVDGTNRAGIRWYELRKSGSTWSIYQQGTFSPDSTDRWMGSIAMDGEGNIALGYSVSGTTTYPSIRYTGRLAGDTLGTLPQGEATLIAGGGSQLHSSGRWGDYSMMAVDPSDDCTFWYTQEYYSTTSVAGWKTRIGSFKFPSCGAAGTYSISGTVTESGGGPLAGVTMTLSGDASGTTTTDASGNYSFTGLPNGNYTVTPSMSGYSFTPASRDVTISGADVAGVDFEGTPSGSGPDLLVTQLSAPSSATAGGSIYVNNSITNQGDQTAPSSKAGFYLSSDNNPSIGPDDVLLGSRDVPVTDGGGGGSWWWWRGGETPVESADLDPGETSTDNTRLTIPSNTSAGTYYIKVMADYQDVVVETNEGNNVSVSGPVDVQAGGVQPPWWWR